MSELNQRDLDELKGLFAPNPARRYLLRPDLSLTRAALSGLIDMAESILAIDYLRDMYCPDCPRFTECDCDEDHEACADWSISNREELLKLYREAQHGKP